MFEGNLVESRGLVASGTERWTALGSFAVQCAVAGLLIAVPLFRPGVLPVMLRAPQVSLPLPPRPPDPPVQIRTSNTASTTASMPAAMPVRVETLPSLLQHARGQEDDNAPMLSTNLQMSGNGPGLFSELSRGTSGQPGISVVRTREAGAVTVSTGVSAGLLLAPIRPVYPAIAQAAGVQGTVVVQAVISKSGRIESLRAVSGPQLLRGAALEAVGAARYRPYLLNGEPTEVETTVTVVFTLGG